MRKRILVVISVVVLCSAVLAGIGIWRQINATVFSEQEARSQAVCVSDADDTSCIEQGSTLEKEEKKSEKNEMTKIGSDVSNSSDVSNTEAKESPVAEATTPRQAALIDFARKMSDLYRAYDDSKTYKREVLLSLHGGVGEITIETQNAETHNIEIEEKNEELYVDPAALVSALGYSLANEASAVTHNTVAFEDNCLILPDNTRSPITISSDSGAVLWSARELAEALGCTVSTTECGIVHIYDTFQTARIIVRSSNEVTDPECVQMVSGLDNMTVLQYADPFEAYRAYTRFVDQPTVEFTEPDAVGFIAESAGEQTQNEKVGDPEHEWKPAEALSWGNAAVGSEAMQVNLYNKYGSISAIPEIKVAVIDTGCKLDHDFLADRLLAGFDFVNYDTDPSDDHGHGTHCAGIVVNNTTENVKILPVKSADAGGTLTSMNIFLGIEYAIEQGVDVINMSFGDYPVNVEEYYSSAEGKAISHAASEGIVLVGAQGNNGRDTSTYFPASHEEVISVSAIDSECIIWDSSNYGATVDLCAPGVSVNSSTYDGGYGKMSGTSMAAPFVSACAALALSEDLSLSRIDVLTRLLDSATDLGMPGWDKYYGYGCVNVSKLIESSYVARIGSTGYPTFAHALAAATDGDEIVLEKDIEVFSTIEIGKNVTIRSEHNQSIKAGQQASLPLFRITGDAKIGDDADTGRTLGILCTENVDAPLVSIAPEGKLAVYGSTKLQTVSVASCTIQNQGVLEVFGATIENTEESAAVVNEGSLAIDDINLRSASINAPALETTQVFRVSGSLDVTGYFKLSNSASINVLGAIPEQNPFVALKINDASVGRIVYVAEDGIDVASLPFYSLDKEWSLSPNNQACILARQDTFEAKIDGKGFASLADALAAAQDGQTVTVCRDVLVDEMLTISKDIVLSANGNFALRASPLLYGALLRIQNGVHASVSCDAGSSLVLNGMNYTRGFSFVQVANGAMLSLGNGVRVSRFISNNAIGISAVYNDGTLVVDGAEIVNNQASYGGGVYTTGIMRFLSGSIAHNEAKEEGGGVYNTGTLDFQNGTLVGNYGTIYGGAVSNHGTLNMTGGEITENRSVAGGGVYNVGAFTLQDGLISRNQAKSITQQGSASSVLGSGGGVKSEIESKEKKSSVVIAGGSICNNEAGVSGGGIHATEIQMSGGSVFDNNSKMGSSLATPTEIWCSDARLQGGTVSSLDSTIHPILISCNGSLEMSGNFTVFGGVLQRGASTGKELAIVVSDAFTPACPVELYSKSYFDGTVVIRYDEDLQPNVTDFTLSDIYHSSYDSLKIQQHSFVFSRTELQVSEGWELNGTCEQRVDELGLLTIRPLGGLKGMLAKGYAGRSDIKDVVIESGVIPPNRTASELFKSCVNLKNADVSGLTDMNGSMSKMFYGCNSLLETHFSRESMTYITDMKALFDGCKSLETLNSTAFETSKVVDMSFMFRDCSSLQVLDVSGFNTSEVTNISSMFAGCSSLTELDVSRFNTSKVTNMSRMFYGCSNLQNLDVARFNTSKVTNMSGMLASCSSLQALDVSGFDTSKTLYMPEVFSGCSSLKTLDVSGFCTSQVINTASMFFGCSSLQALDVSGFNTSQVEDMSNLFAGCNSLASIIDDGDFLPSESCNTAEMFVECIQLVGGNGTSYDADNTNGTFACVDSTDHAGYFTNRHRHIWDYGVCTEEPSCAQAGKMKFTCTVDSSHVREEVLPALGHKWGEWTIDVAARCDQAGSESRTCERCSETQEREIPTLEHVPGEPVRENEVAPTCTADGSYNLVIHCINCNAPISSSPETEPALGHKWGEWKVLSAADCTNEGSKRRICTHCGTYEKQIIPALGHEAGAAESENRIQPTCETEGFYVLVTRCKKCNQTLSSSRKTLPALGHAWDSGKIAVPATETTEGVVTYTCTRCSRVRQESIPKLKPGQDNRNSDISQATISGVSNKAYTGKAIKPVPTVKLGGKKLSRSTDFKLKYSSSNPKTPGTYRIILTGIGSYHGTNTVSYKILRASNKVSVAKTSLSKKLSASTLSRKAKKFALPKVTLKFGMSQWKVVSADKKKVLSLRNNALQVKKKAKSGIYVIKIKAKVQGNKCYKSASSKTVTVKLTITSEASRAKLQSVGANT